MFGLRDNWNSRGESTTGLGVVLHHEYGYYLLEIVLFRWSFLIGRGASDDV